MSQSDSLLLSLRELNKLGAVPDVLLNILGDFLWAERIANVEEIAPQKIKITFYSDGLALSAKTEIEKFLIQYLIDKFESVVVNFSKKNKPEPKKEAPKQAPEQTSQEAKAKKADKAPQGRTPQPKKEIPGVKRIIAVASGKGGVGKSTVSVNLALSLHNQGYKVGILDADIYGPSVPTMLNVHEDPVVNAENKIIPPESFGLKVMSFGFFAPEETAVIWRGPMIMKALQQFFYDVNWGELDFLVIDLPPGTGDAQLTLVQSLPITGAVIVTTPQNVALLDAVKGIALFEKTEVPILGIVENMSTFTCPTCSEETFIFGTGGAERVSKQFSIPILGHMPLVPEIRVAGDIGEPLTSIKGHGIRNRFSEIAEKVVERCVN